MAPTVKWSPSAVCLPILAAWFTIINPVTATAQQAAGRFVGSWMLVSWYNITDDGQPMPSPVEGTDPHGILMFDAQNHFSLLIATERPRWQSPDRMEGTDEENKLAARGTLAYYGTYSVNEADGTFTLKVERSLHPNLNGTSQSRRFTLSGDELRYSTPPFKYPKGTFTGHFVWKRAS